ncbi:hypothetical protein GQ457_11G033180 [Hibiscus cannabinus]
MAILNAVSQELNHGLLLINLEKLFSHLQVVLVKCGTLSFKKEISHHPEILKWFLLFLVTLFCDYVNNHGFMASSGNSTGLWGFLAALFMSSNPLYKTITVDLILMKKYGSQIKIGMPSYNSHCLKFMICNQRMEEIFEDSKLEQAKRRSKGIVEVVDMYGLGLHRNQEKILLFVCISCLLTHKPHTLLVLAADFPLLRELGSAIFASFGKEFPNFALLIIRVDLVEILA